MRRTRTSATGMFTACVLGVAAIAGAQTAMSITPTKGQSAAQVETDKAECSAIAQQSAAPAAAPAEPQRGGRVRGAAAGAAVGAAGANRRGGEAYDRAPDSVQDEYRQEQARKGAAAGAVAGGIQQRRSNREAGSQQAASGQQALDSAFKSCLMGRGYNVQ